MATKWWVAFRDKMIGGATGAPPKTLPSLCSRTRTLALADLVKGECGCVRRERSTLFSSTKEGRAIAEAKGKGSGKSGASQAKRGGKGRGGSKDGGTSGGDADRIRKLEANNKRLAEELRKEKAANTDAEDDGEVGDEEMDDDLTTKEDWDRVGRSS